MKQLTNAQNTLSQAIERLKRAMGMSPTGQELAVELGVKVFFENSDIVATMVTDEATVKRMSIEGEHIELRPGNQKLKPIIIGQQDELKIIGKALHVCSGTRAEALLDEPQGG